MLVNHKKSLIFVHIPKTAGGSLKSSLPGERYTFADGIHAHSTIKEIRQLKPEWSDYRSVAFFRNPFERLHSIWKFWHADIPFKAWLLKEESREWHNGTPYTSPLPLQKRPQLDWVDSNTELFWFGEIEKEYVRMRKLFGKRIGRLRHTHASNRQTITFDEEMTRHVVEFHGPDIRACPTLELPMLTVIGLEDALQRIALEGRPDEAALPHFHSRQM